ncbi:MAG: lipopolysaccharide biosynthesis protein [Hyphomicrobiaceae bacterium]|nr:lipopolysaccharide biosynthesis protein [Hyphomicrobiaceae bacterium]
MSPVRQQQIPAPGPIFAPPRTFGQGAAPAPAIGQKIIRGAIWTALETWGEQAAQFAVFIILARLIGPQALGLAVLAMVAPVILGVVVKKGIPDALVQRVEIDPLHLDSAFWLLAAAGVLLTAAVWLAAGLVAEAFGEPLLAELVRWTSLVIVMQALAAVPAAVLKRQLEFRLLALRTLIGIALGGAVGLGMAFAGYGVWSLVAIQVVKSATEALVLLAAGKWRPRLRFSASHCRDLFGFAGPIVGFSLWSFVNDELPKTVLGLYLGSASVGIYTLARKPLELLSNVLLYPISGIAMASVARLQNDPERIDRFFDSSVRMAALVGVPAFAGLALVAPGLVPLVLGEQWISGVPAIQILMLLGLVRTIDGIAANTALALGHSALIFVLNVAYTPLAAVLLVGAAPFGIEAAMAAIVTCNLLLLPVFLILMRRLAGVAVMRPLAAYPRLALATALMALAVTGWRLVASGAVPPGVSIAVAILIGIVVYTGTAFIVARRELGMARDILNRFRG